MTTVRRRPPTLRLERIGRVLALGTAIFLATAGYAGAQAPSSSRAGPVPLAPRATRQADASPQERPERGRRRGRRSELVFKERITPFWFHDNTRFWYRNELRGGTSEFILVDAERGTRQTAFDHARLAAALSSAAGEEYAADRLPFARIEFVDDAQSIRFAVGDGTWKCSLATYECVQVSAEAPASAADGDRDLLEGRRPRRRGSRGERRASSPLSPDGKWIALVEEHNLYIRASDDETQKFQLSSNGAEDSFYDEISWAPDSATLIAFRVAPAERQEVYLVESSPPGGGRARLLQRGYSLPGDAFTTYELNVFNVANRAQLTPEVDRFEHEWLRPRLRWTADGSRFAYEQTDRGHQRFRVIEVDPKSGAARNVIDETSTTFIWTAHTENLRLDRVNWLDSSGEIIYASERDGWRHLYLVDVQEGATKNPITTGEWVVRGIDRIDEDARQVWFHAGGRIPEQDPYLLHYYRVGFDGSGLTALTEGDGNHSVEYSPDGRYLIDTYSRAERPPVHELRRASDGTLVCTLEEADISALVESGWQPPEVFVAKGRDGTTDIWGLIHRPRELDPEKKYPVIESIYAGPQGSFVPKSFNGGSRFGSLTDLGFIVVQIDGMGTANRSKVFQDVCWQNLKDAGLPDRILWHRAVAEKYPYYDISRVGIFGNSAGGQSAAAALLFHPEFYKVAVASCGCHDNRMDKASWNEQWMGYPVGPHYAESSNIENAHRLRGKLLLIVGELDQNVPPESTLRFVDALVKAGKDFDLLVIPGGGHGMGGDYGQRRMEDFFARHLLGVEPPDRNAEEAR